VEQRRRGLAGTQLRSSSGDVSIPHLTAAIGAAMNPSVPSISRLARRVAARLTLLSGWAWIAAGSLVGFEVLDVLFGSFVLAPEIVPLVLLALALAWLFRERLRRARSRLRARRRLARIARGR
jgi:hypothetical protein